ncbi:MAG TPA: PKD domain-containing protein [Cyclobacteriaceae bacterium]|nr:PKD domain-containing protein [Cyclobacteriaceae bacterium]
MYFRRVSFLILLWGTVLTGAAQNLAQHNWYFGNSANAIRFNRGTNKAFTVSNKAVPFGTGGSAVATDPANANLFFYTDGVNVYNANNVAMPNGNGLTANSSSNQPVVICPKPGDSTLFYIFTNTASYVNPAGATGTISIDSVDMKLFGGSVFPAPPLGDVKNPKNGLIAGLTNRAEGMLIIPHSNGTDYWLITQQSSSQNFAATLVDKTKTFPTTVTSGLGVPMSAANFSYSKKLKKVAVSAQDPSTDAIILNFNDATGSFTFDRYIYNTGTNTTTNQSIYDIEWDNKGQYLYISRVGETGINADVLQYDYLNPGNTLASVLKAPEFRSWGLQLAPDSAIYHIYQAISGGPFLVEKFTKTDTLASSVIQTTAPFGALDFKGTQFPSFIPKISFKLGLSFTPVGTCQGNNTTFFPNVIPNADSLRWDLGDTTVTDWSPVHKYTTAQTYNVTLTAYYQGQTQSVTQPVTINTFDLKLTLPSDTTACHDEFPTPYGTSTRFTNSFHVKVKASGNNSSGATFAWSDGETGNTLWPLKPGYYYVVATDASSGCSSYAGVNVKEYGLQDQRANIWYFGNNAGIDFNPEFATPPGPAVPLSGSNMDAPAGCAIICDRNGQTIFYTDGDKVYDKTKTQIDVGIGGDPLATQSSLIAPVPGDETLYYIFATQAINGVSGDELRYSLFDLKLNSGNGGLVKKNVLLFSKSTERITANDSWLIAHEYGNNTFRAYKITAGGLGDPVFSSIGSVHSFSVAANGQGYMKIGVKNTVAVALSTPGTSNSIELFHLNDSTGMLSNYQQINLSNTSGQVYGVEFSGGGNKVFASVSGAASSDIYEYALDSLGHATFKRDSVFNVKIGALQMAPDNRIYVAIDNSSKLGIITPVDDVKLKSPIDMGTGFALAGGTNSRLGLPNFVQHQSNGFGGPGFTFTGVCLGDTTVFNGQATDAIDKFFWTFGDGGTDKTSQPKHFYGKAGTYTVKMNLTNRCGLNVTITQQVTINPPPAIPSINPHGSICAATGIVLDANTPNTPGLSYAWSTGDTTKTITVLKPAFLINVTNTDKNGCHSTAQTNVVSDVMPVNLGIDQTVCQNTLVAALDAQNAGNNYAWKINGTAASTSQFQGVDTTVPGVFTYTVTVTNPITNCVTNGQTTFTVIQSPTFNFTSTPTACGAATGTITVSTISVPHIYSYFLTGPSGFNQQGIDQPTTTTTIGPVTGMAAGTYSAIITDQVSGCTISNSVAVNSGTFTVTPSTASSCDPPKLTITTTATPTWTYSVTNGTTGVVTSSSTPFSGASQIIQLPSQGTGTTVSYTVQVADAAGCVIAPNYTIVTSTPTPITIASNLCANPATLTASSGSSFSWTGPAISGSTTGQSISITAGGTYQVTALSSGCSVTQSATVNYNGPFTPDFTYNSCQDQVVLVAAPVGANFTYRWYENGAVAPNSSYVGQQVFAGLAPYNKSVVLEMTDSQSGCTLKSASQQVQVVGQLTASLTSTIACDDGKNFTLTATTNATSPAYAWSLDGAAISGVTGATTQQTSAGTYHVDVTQANCKASASIQIIKSPIPVGALAVRYQICNDPDNHDPKTKTVDLDPGFFSAYNWFKNDVQLSPPVTSEVYTADSEGNYRVDLTNTFGCVASNKTVVINDCEPIIAGPNVFRPSSTTAENTAFQLYTFYISTFEIIVYNRWGEPIYESKDEKFKWNGGYNNNPGQPLPGDTYTYLVRYTSSFHPERGIQEQRGGVVLLR